MRAWAISRTAIGWSVLSWAGCTAQPPDVEPQPSKLADAGSSAFADLIVSYTEAGNPITCTDSLAPVCQTQTGVCSNHPVLGAADNQSFSLVGPGQIEVGFLCQPIVDRAPNSELSPDFRILGTIDSGSGAIVSVSENGSDYFVLDNWTRDDQSFDLSNRGLEYARFVRVAAELGASVSIDAIEALP